MMNGTMGAKAAGATGISLSLSFFFAKFEDLSFSDFDFGFFLGLPIQSQI